MKNPELRPLSDADRELLRKLFKIDFAGRSELLQQIPTLLTKTIDENGSLLFQVPSSILSPAKTGPVVEARYADANTGEDNPAHVNILLHVKDGKLSMLEIFKDDSSRILKKPSDVVEFDLFTRFPPPASD
jgi:hypothetical protein